ncbi:MAG: acid phosphatase [Dehalococcoidia bacterium]
MIRGRPIAMLALAGTLFVGLLPPPSVGAQQASVPIDHLLVIYLENHTFDNLYGQFPGANGLQSPAANIRQVDREGVPYRTLPNVPDPRFPTSLPNSVFPMDPFVPLDQKPPTPSHVFYTHQLQVNEGRMDKYVTYSGVGGAPMGYADTAKLPLYPWAREFTLADNWFTSAWGGSWMNHMWLVCACTARFPNAPVGLVSKPIFDAQGRLIGLDGPEQYVTPDGWAVNDLQPFYPPFMPGTPEDQRVPPQAASTIGERLSEAGVSWAWYAGGWDDILEGKNPENFVWHHQPFLYFEAFRPGSDNRARHLKDQTDLVNAIENGTLPAVSFLKPVGEFDEHAGYSTILYSEQHVAALLTRIRQSRSWNRIAVVITYDDYGGWFDHVPPSPKDRWGPGGRVPAIVVSPWARKSYVDPTLYETVSILRFIEWRWGLTPLNERDASANNLLNAFDFGPAEPTTIAGEIARILGNAIR